MYAKVTKSPPASAQEIFSIEPAPELQQTANTKKKQPIAPKTKKVTNSISPNDLGYYQLFSTHYPEEFTLTVNGKAIKNGESIEVKENKLTIKYEYSWKVPFGKRTGAKEVTFEIPKDKNEVEITFAGWKASERILISQAKKLSDETPLSK